LIDIGSHHADLCCWFADRCPIWVSALHGNYSEPEHPQFQDFAQVSMRFGGGALAHWEVDWLNPESMKHFGDTRVWLQGTTGKIELRLGEEVSGTIWTHQSPACPLEVDDIEPAEDWTRRLLGDLAHGRPCAIPQEDVWRAARVTLWAFDSAQAGGRPIEP